MGSYKANLRLLPRTFSGVVWRIFWQDGKTVRDRFDVSTSFHEFFDGTNLTSSVVNLPYHFRIVWRIFWQDGKTVRDQFDVSASFHEFFDETNLTSSVVNLPYHFHIVWRIFWQDGKIVRDQFDVSASFHEFLTTNLTSSVVNLPYHFRWTDKTKPSEKKNVGDGLLFSQWQFYYVSKFFPLILANKNW